MAAGQRELTTEPGL